MTILLFIFKYWLEYCFKIVKIAVVLDNMHTFNRMKTIYTLLFALLVTPSFAGPGDDKKDKVDDPTLITIGKKKVGLSEFKYIYEKNNSKSDDAYTEKSIKEYLELFINFKLKVFEAESLGMDTVKSFQKELAGYQKQLAKPYLTEKSVTEKLIKEAYERKKEEIHASHILVKLREDAAPSDTLAAYNKIQEIRKKALKGEDFGVLAQKNSDDPSAKNNKGDLGYFTALKMVYPFENAAYNTPKGQISEPTRTRFGYHIVKVHDRRPYSGKVTIAHIMIEAASGISAEDSLKAKQKIDEIYQGLKKGDDWNQSCQAFSTHQPSKSKNGELKPFSVGELGLPMLEDAAFKLEKSGDISAPVKSPYGWHIVKLIEKKELEPLEDLEPQIRQQVNKLSRSDLNRKALIERLKTEDHFKQSKGTIKKALKLSDTTLTQGKWKYDTENKLNKKTLFSIDGKKYLVKDFFEYVQKGQRPKIGASDQYLFKKAFEEYQAESLIEYEESHLESKYDAYRLLVKEYRDGILLFELMDNKVWSKAVKDTVGLKEFYNSHTHNYQWKKRVKATIYDVIDEHHKDVLLELLDKNLTQLDIETKINEDNPLNAQVESGIYQLGDKEVLDKVKWEKGNYTVKHGDRIYYVMVEEVLEAAPKEFKEARGLVISDYQNYLESEWIKTLREKYPVEVNQEELQKIIK